MTDDTVSQAPTTPAATRAADNASIPEARRADGAAALLGRAVHERLAAAARLAVAVGLAEAGAERFAGLTGQGDGFPQGSDYGALCPQEDLSRAQAEVIHQDAQAAVQAEAERMTQDAPRRAAVIARQLAAWQEGAALEWADMVRIKAELDREDAEDAARAG